MPSDTETTPKTTRTQSPLAAAIRLVAKLSTQIAHEMKQREKAQAKLTECDTGLVKLRALFTSAEAEYQKLRPVAN